MYDTAVTGTPTDSLHHGMVMIHSILVQAGLSTDGFYSMDDSVGKI